MPLLCEGEIVQFNLKDALEVLTEEEAVILDMLVEKVQKYTEEKELKERQKQIEAYKIMLFGGPGVGKTATITKVVVPTNVINPGKFIDKIV